MNNLKPSRAILPALLSLFILSANQKHGNMGNMGQARMALS